ncbi:MAG: phosphatidylserine decarboxylase family protein [Bacteroidota bacterium]|nr:phosphatidylserine decarboxylase family protein [Bacteroidota bacterium]
MKIHKEGKNVILVAFLIFVAINSLMYLLAGSNPAINVVTLITLVMLALVIWFFRVPNFNIELRDGYVLAPADGKVVVIEETTELEYLKDSRIQVSIFMSPLNVHINWFPVGGIVKYYKHHSGRFMAAWLPKASTENERATTVIETKEGIPVLVRQIAGAMARRIVSYGREGMQVRQDEQLGFIKFGSRVDVFLPLGSEIKVEIGQKATGSQTVIAKLP